MVLRAAVDQGMIVRQMDVKGAYFNAPIAQELYVRQPKRLKNVTMKMKT